MISFLFLFIGLVMLVGGAESAFRGTVSISQHLKLSKGFVGLVILGFGTSLPELFVSSFAAHEGRGSIALGNVTGSNITNILLILAAALLIFPPKKTLSMQGLFKPQEAIAIMAATGVFIVLVHLNGFSFAMGIILVATLLSYLFFDWQRSRTSKNKTEEEKADTDTDADAEPMPFLWAFSLSVLGLVLLFIGSQFFVQGASDLAALIGVPTGIIGLSITAIGTSLPELSVALSASRKGEYSVVIGNVLGSCLFNLLAVTGVASLIAPIHPGEELFLHVTYVLPVATAAALVVIYFLRQIARPAGFLLMISFFAWLSFLSVQAG
ncbi:MAG: sodium:calcium antiporter [Alphaproteobacteria bacterium]|nr:sodium:calcium antiporter [Alphaproteobacteria bacterium]